MDPNLAEAERRIEEALRTGAERLDLGDLALPEIPPRIGKLERLRTLALGRAPLTEDGELVWSNERELASFEDLSPLSALQELHSLDLTGCERLTDLAPIAEIGALRKLSLGFCSGVWDLAPLAALKELRWLDLTDCDWVMDLAPLAALGNLETLDLSACVRVADLAPLATLERLESLELFECPGVTDVAPLAGLHGLRSLDLGATGVTDIAPLAALRGLRWLGLLATGANDLRPTRGIADLAPLAALAGLERLELMGCEGLTDFAPLASLRGLRRLGLSHTGVADLSPLAPLHRLQLLNLGSCEAITDFFPLAGLTDLRYLDLTSCPPVAKSTLRRLAGLPKLEQLLCFAGEEVPPEVLSQGEAEYRPVLSDEWDEWEDDDTWECNCLPHLRSYFAEIDQAAEAENEVKVVLLGNGGVGKTQLCRRFRGEAFDGSIASTHGVQLWREELRIAAGTGEEAFQVNWWDFGGQDIYHGTHALFLRSRALFLILWTPALENRDEHEEDDIQLRNQPLAYWLDYVRSLAGNGVPVIVVQSRCDEFAQDRSAIQKPEGVEFFRCCPFSARTDLGKETLAGMIRDGIRFLQEKSGALEIGRSRAEVRRRLYAWRAADQARAPEEREHRSLTLEEFRALCDEVGGVASWEHALDYFHETGVVFHHPTLFSRRILLDQSWALDAVYAVFDRRRAAPVLRDLGRFTREHLALLVWREHEVQEQELFLDLMESCGICFACRKDGRGETVYVAPDLLPPFAAVERRLQAWREDPATPGLRLEYRFFHQAIVRGLMRRVGWIAGDVAEYWKYGFWLFDRKRDTQVLVRQIDAGRDESPGAGALVIESQGRDALGLMRQIRREALWQEVREKPEESLTLGGVTVRWGALAHEIGGQVRAVDGSIVPAAPYAAFFQDREVLAAVEPSRPGREDRLDLDPAPAPASAKRSEVFLSYAWGDETPEGRRRGEVADQLQTALEEDGWTVERDRDAVRPGDRITPFMRRLTKADRIVAVISDRYLRSWPCMFEIYRIYQRSQADADEFVRRVVPILLPDVRLGSVEERLPYMEHWAERAAKLDALVRNPAIRPSRESWEEVRLVQEFAHHVDAILCFIQDILMPRQLEAQFGDGFQAVREALRRRLGE